MPEPDVFELLATLSPQEGVLALQEAGARDHVPARAAKLEVLASARDWATTDERKAALRRALMRRLGRDIRPEAGVPGFHVVRRLGMGAFGHVFLAIEEESGHQVALKVFHGYAFEEHERAEALDRFRRGTRMLRDFDGQPGFVRVLRDGAEDDPPWLAMEYYPLGNLGEYLNRRRRQGDPVPVATICELVTSVCTAVGHAHACGVIHRDIKPTNILLQESGDGRLHACLGDFDLAFPRGETALTGMTGTLAYMPPETQLEVLHGAPPLMLPLSPKLADRSVMQDVYAVAGVLFFALTGAVPQFTEGRAAEIADCFRSEGERRREVGESGLLTRLEPLLQQALHRDPGRRPQTASELGEMIRWAMHVGDTPPPAVDRLRAAPEAPSFSEVTEDRFGRVAAVRAAAA
jgi:serine/threonine protein kinase